MYIYVYNNNNEMVNGYILLRLLLNVLYSVINFYIVVNISIQYIYLHVYMVNILMYG